MTNLVYILVHFKFLRVQSLNNRQESVSFDNSSTGQVKKMCDMKVKNQRHLYSILLV